MLWSNAFLNTLSPQMVIRNKPQQLSKQAKYTVHQQNLDV